MRKTYMILAMLICVFLLSGTAYATEDLPPIVPAFYDGTVKNTEGNTIKSGTIKAFIENELKGELEFTNGSYTTLIVEGDPTTMNKSVTFKVTIDGKDYAAESNSLLWVSGAISGENGVPNVNLIVDYSGPLVDEEQPSEQTNNEQPNSEQPGEQQNETPATSKVINLTIGKVEASVNDSPYTLDCEPYVNNEAQRTMVPLRFVSEALGAQVDWLAETRQIVIKDTKTITLGIGSLDALIDGEKTVMDSAPEVMSTGRTFVPLRFVSETLGAQVDYDGPTKGITITR